MNANRTQGTQPNAQTSTRRVALRWVEAVAKVALVVVAIAVLSIVRDIREDLSRANADLARMNATNAPSANLDR